MKWMLPQVSLKIFGILGICLFIVFGIFFKIYQPLSTILLQQAKSVPCLQTGLTCWQLPSPNFTEITDLFKYEVGEIFLVKREILAGNIFNILPIYRDLYFLKINMKVTKHDAEDISGFSAAHTMLTTRSPWWLTSQVPLSFLYPFSEEEANLVSGVPIILPQESATGSIVYDITNVSAAKGDELLLTIVNLPKNVGGVKLLTLKSTWQLFHF